MSRSLLYLTNNTTTSVSAGSTIPLGSITRKVGSAFTVGTSSVYINTPGYYTIDLAGSYTGGTAGLAQVDLLQNGNTIATAKDTIGTASTEYHSFSIPAVIRVYCCAGATISASVDSGSAGALSFGSLGLRIVKE